MTQLGRFCKAYPASRLREFRDWHEHRDQIQTKEWIGEDGSVSDEAYFFVQENLVVTDGIGKDEHVIFDAVTPEWRTFCLETLGFPADRLEQTAASRDVVSAAAE
jgi:hypothetical protein